MDMEELSCLFKIRKNGVKLHERLLDIKCSSVSIQSPSYDGMPKSTAHCSQEESYINKLSCIENAIALNKITAIEKEIELWKYINTIPDSYIRLIFVGRFIYCLSWDKIASRLGESETADGVKKACYRYLKSEKRD